jgi:hypothetical protein
LLSVACDHVHVLCSIRVSSIIIIIASVATILVTIISVILLRVTTRVFGLTTCHWVTGNLLDVQFAINDVLHTYEGLDWTGGKYLSKADLSQLIDVHFRFMTVTSSLLTALGCYITYKTMICE